MQTIELPPVVATVTAYPGHARTCPRCGPVTRAAIPRDLIAHRVGPRLTAALSYLAGRHGVGKRGVEEIAAALCDAPVALGTVANLEPEVSAALAAAWKLRGKLCWLWAAASADVVAFVIHGRRSAAGLTALLGLEIQGILSSDRWGVSDRVPAERRQLCWAHWKRDFQKISDRGGPDAAVGLKGRKLVKQVLAAWQAFRDGRCTPAQLQAQLTWAAPRFLVHPF